MTEEWRPVVGFEGLYEVSDLGRVRSLDRVVTRSDGVRRRFPGVVRRLNKDKKGYLQVGLCCTDKQITARVHSLVAEAFIGPRPKGMQVLHGKDDKSDNRAGNLKYGTPAQNVAEKMENGRTMRGEKCHFHKLTVEEIHVIRGLADRRSQAEIAVGFGLTQQGVSDIIARRSWRHV